MALVNLKLGSYRRINLLVEELKKHRKLIVDSFREAMEFKAFTDISYVLARRPWGHVSPLDRHR
jgi:hypothetical protein